MKEWSKRKVAVELNYLKPHEEGSETHLHHARFSSWIEGFVLPRYKNKQVTIFDIGCGNSVVVNYLSDNVKYNGIDINESLIEYSNNAYKSKKDNFIKVCLQDIEEELSQETKQMIHRSQICYIDSVFTMLANPKKVLKEILIPNFDIIFLGRTRVNTNRSFMAYLGEYLWPGMENPSPLWHFGEGFFKSIFINCDHHVDMSILPHNNVVIMKKGGNKIG